MLGWEYRKPERVPAACPFNPAALCADVTFSSLKLGDGYIVPKQEVNVAARSS
jgi:hypothetical protein